MQVLSLDQAAYKAGMVRRTLERLLAEGLGPAKVQLSKRRVGILDSDLDRWLASRRVPQPGTEFSVTQNARRGWAGAPGSYRPRCLDDDADRALAELGRRDQPQRDFQRNPP